MRVCSRRPALADVVSTASVHMPYGARIYRSEACGLAILMTLLAVSISCCTSVGSHLDRSGRVIVWFATSCPSAIIRRISFGWSAAYAPITQNVAGTRNGPNKSRKFGMKKELILSSKVK
ncbi:hypothetical protein OKW41_000059 [Paraburkholderia sp. UCT70]